METKVAMEPKNKLLVGIVLDLLRPAFVAGVVGHYLAAGPVT